MRDLAARFTDAMPVGFTGIALFFGAAVHRNKISAGVGDDFYKFETVRVLLPARACLHGDGDRDGVFYFADNLGGAIRIFDERGTVEIGNKVVHGTAHVDVDGVGLETVVNDFGGLGHHVGIGAKDLLDDGTLALVKARHFEGLGIQANDGLGTHHFTEHQRRAFIFTDDAEWEVRHVGHGGKGDDGFGKGFPIDHGAEYTGLMEKNKGLRIFFHEKPQIAAVVFGLVLFLIILVPFVFSFVFPQFVGNLFNIFSNLPGFVQTLLATPIIIWFILQLPLLLISNSYFPIALADYSSPHALFIFIILQAAFSASFWTVLVYVLHRVSLRKLLTKFGKKGTE